MNKTRTKKRPKQQNTNLPVLNSKGATANSERNLNQFLQSLGEALIEITALEINTIVVEQISADKFIAWETYREIYPICPDYLEQQAIHPSLRDRYLSLRRTLEQEYRSLLSDPDSELYDPTALDSTPVDHALVLGSTRLPNPIQSNSSEEITKIQRVLHNCRFLRGLRKMYELKVTLDSRNQILLNHQTQQLYSSEAIQTPLMTDMIYAQTIIQLDGDIMNRYAREVLDHPQRDLILDIHQESISASQNQWRGLLEFIIGLVQATLKRGS